MLSASWALRSAPNEKSQTYTAAGAVDKVEAVRGFFEAALVRAVEAAVEVDPPKKDPVDRVEGADAKRLGAAAAEVAAVEAVRLG